MERIECNGELIMELESKGAWISRVPRHLRPKAPHETYLWIDINGNVLKIGEDFAAAEEQHSYPVRVYLLQRVSEVKNADKPIFALHPKL